MRTIFLALLMVSASLAGCFGDEEKAEVIAETDVWGFDKPDLTWFNATLITPCMYTTALLKMVFRSRGKN